MTTFSDTPTASAPRRTVSLLAIVGTLPYLALKVAWLSGSRVGLVDDDFGRSAVMHVANAVTLAMDAVAVLLAITFVARWRLRTPAPVVLAPLWVGTGLLAPIVVVVPLQLVLGVPDSGQASGPIADWVYLVVYGGFMWQGVFLLLGFALFAHERWGHLARRPLPQTPVSSTSLAACGLLMLTGILTVLAAGQRAEVSWPNLIGDVAAIVVAAVGVVTLHRGRGPRWRAVVATWIGSGAVLTWSLYRLILLTVPNDLVGDQAVTVLDRGTAALGMLSGTATLLAARQIARVSAGASDRSPAR